MKIGTKLVLHKVAFPELDETVDDIRLVTVVEEKPVPMMYGKGQEIGLMAVDSEGREYFNSWDRFPDDSSSPRWRWTRAKPEGPNYEGWEWFDITHAVAIIPQRPIFMDRKELKGVLGYCDKHHRLFYESGEYGCWECQVGRPPFKIELRGWKGWF